jgi:hypothetical protein
VPPKAPIEPCNAKLRLIARLEAAHAKISRINSRKIQALVRDDTASDAALSTELGTAREERNNAADELRVHIAEHGR